MAHLIGLKEQQVKNVCFSLLFFLDLLWWKVETKAINSIYLRSVSHRVIIPKMFSLYAPLLICLVFQSRPAYLFILYDFFVCVIFFFIIHFFKDMVGRKLL